MCFKKFVGIFLLIFAITLYVGLTSCARPQGALGPVGPPGPPGPPAIQQGAAIVVTPTEVYGSGFTPNSKVVVGIDRFKDGEAVVLEAVTANKYGAFEAKTVGDGIKYLKLEPGIYTIIAKENSGRQATAPLVIEKKK